MHWISLHWRKQTQIPFLHNQLLKLPLCKLSHSSSLVRYTCQSPWQAPLNREAVLAAVHGTRTTSSTQESDYLAPNAPEPTHAARAPVFPKWAQQAWSRTWLNASKSVCWYSVCLKVGLCPILLINSISNRRNHRVQKVSTIAMEARFRTQALCAMISTSEIELD